jgi:hypothetical protein
MNALLLRIHEEVIIRNCHLFCQVSLMQPKTKSLSGRSLCRNFAAIEVNLLCLGSIDFTHTISQSRYKYQEYRLSSIFEVETILTQYHYRKSSIYHLIFEAYLPF